MVRVAAKKDLSGGESVIPLRSSASPISRLRFVTNHKKRPAIVDLNEFAEGVSTADVEAGKVRPGRILFNRRPQLIEELAPYIYRLHCNSSESTVRVLISSLRWWWNFFDQFELLAPPGYRFISVSQWNATHYAFYSLGTTNGSRPCSVVSAGMFFNLLEVAREAIGLAFWWSAIPAEEKQRPLMTHDEVRLLYQHFKTAARNAVNRIENEWPKDNVEVHSVDALMHCLPRRDELVSLAVLFMIQSGWNPQVVLDIDISAEENGQPACIRQSLGSPNTHSRVISTKERAGGKIQITESWNKDRFSPANLLLFLIEKTAAIRAVFRSKLTTLQESFVEKMKAQESRNELDEMVVKIAKLEAVIKSPWLFMSMRGKVGVLSGNSFTYYGKERQIYPALAYATECINRDLRARKEKAELESTNLLKPLPDYVRSGFYLTDLRDAFIAWRFETTGYSWLEALFASGSSSVTALRSYLNKKRLVAYTKKLMIRGVDEIFDAIQLIPVGTVAVKHFPTIAAARVAGANDEQINRWIDGLDRTYSGTGCSNIMNPPVHVDPTHVKGRPCATQRCLICREHAVLIVDTHGANDLAKVRAELEHTRAKLSMLSWEQSNYPLELDNIKFLWHLFESRGIDSMYASWKLKIEIGHHQPIQLAGHE